MINYRIYLIKADIETHLSSPVKMESEFCKQHLKHKNNIKLLIWNISTLTFLRFMLIIFQFLAGEVYGGLKESSILLRYWKRRDQRNYCTQLKQFWKSTRLSGDEATRINLWIFSRQCEFVLNGPDLNQQKSEMDQLKTI